MKKEIVLLHKKILVDKSPVLISYQADENWSELWDAKRGDWYYEDGYLIGSQPENCGGILLSKQYFKQDVMLTFTVSTVLPATRDLNAVYCLTWDENTNYIERGYVSGLNGWYTGKSGIERVPAKDFRSALTPLYHYEPGTEVKITTGAIHGHNFLIVDDVLIQEFIDIDPLIGGHVGISPYSTVLKIKDIEVREIQWAEIKETYTPEF